MKVIPLHRAYRSEVPSQARTALRSLDVSAPRYASYPTADHFVEAFDANAYQYWLRRRQTHAVTPLALYVHSPFCAAACHHCACNKIVTRSYAKAQDYLRHLEREIDMVAKLLGPMQRVNQLHWGGGTPNFYRPAELAQLMRCLKSAFQFQPGGEYSIEIDPRASSLATIGLLAELGFNRLSIGVQDFDAAVQQAIHRVQPTERVAASLRAARDAGFASVNFDLIYGLPRQTVESFERTVEQIVEMRPDRIGLFSYAHMPERFRNQRHIHSIELPSQNEKMTIFSTAVARLNAAGYVYIGLDHFALRSDALAVAHRAGRLHRDFQGYSSQPEGDLIGLGASAISRIGAAYSQNHRAPADYADAIGQGLLPVMRGLELSADDLARRTVIQALMSQSQVSIESVEIAHLIDFNRYFTNELEALEPWVRAGLVERDQDWISVNAPGRQYVCAISACFDRHQREASRRDMLDAIL